MIDIGQIITQNLSKQADRKGHNGISVGDVANGCVRAKWHELHRGIRKEFDGPTRKKFEYGYALEKVVQSALEAAGYEVGAPCVLIFHPDGSVDQVPAQFFDEHPSEWAKTTDVVGHPDIIARKKPVDVDTPTLLVEVKSTMLFRNGSGAPQHPDTDTLRLKSGNYMLQGAAYAKGVGAKKFAVYVSDRGTGLDATYWFDTDAEYPAFLVRLEEMQAALNPEIEPQPNPPAWTRNAKGISYLCRAGACPVKSCVNNLTK